MTNKTELTKLIGEFRRSYDAIGQAIENLPTIMVYDDQNEWAETLKSIWETGDPRVELLCKKFRKGCTKIPKPAKKKKIGK